MTTNEQCRPGGGGAADASITGEHPQHSAGPAGRRDPDPIAARWHVETERDLFIRFDVVAADPKLRANALVLARRRRAHRRYRMLVHAFAQHDRKRGVEVPPEIVKRTLAAGPEPRRMSERELERWWR